MPKINLKNDTAPGTPPSDYTSVYAKTDGLVYIKKDDGTELCITAAPASGTPVTQTPDQSNAAGTAGTYALADHVHNIPAAAASSISTSSSSAEGTASSFARSDHTHAVSITNSATASTSLISTTSTSYTLMTGMTLTPAAGTYIAFARACVSATSNNRTINMAIYVGGSIDTNSEVTTFIRTGAGFLSTTDISSLCTEAIVTVNGSQAIEIKWKTSGGTAQAQGYGLTLLKVS